MKYYTQLFLFAFIQIFFTHMQILSLIVLEKAQES